MDSYSLGRYLKESREALDLTLDEAVDSLKIRRYILESFEQGDFQALDTSAVQTRGFIRNYARFLKLDPDLVLQYYDSAMHSQERGNRRRGRKSRQREREETPPRRLSASDTNPRRPENPPTQTQSYGEQQQASRQRLLRFLNLLMVTIVAVAAIGVIGFVVLQLLGNSDALEGDGSSDILGQLPPTPTETVAPTFTPRPQATSLPVLQQEYTGSGVLVTLEMKQRSWLRVTTDGTEQMTGLAVPGDVMEFEALDEIVVTASNAEALNVVYNGQQQGAFGGRGQAVDIMFTAEDVDIVTGPGYEPTSEFTPTITPTREQLAATLMVARTPTATDGPSPTPSATFTPSNTPTITPTPSNTPTITPTPSATLTPSITPTPSDTPTPSLTPTITLTPSATFTPSPTAILPPRVTVTGVTATPTKPNR